MLDHCGLAVLVNGEATVTHRRASDAAKNFLLEEPGRAPNEDLWAHLEQYVLLRDPSDIIGSYREVTDHMAAYFFEHDQAWAHHFVRARDACLDVFA